MSKPKRVGMFKLREALEASWDSKTSYLNVSKEGNPALGQCYPTARVIQYYFPETEIVEGQVWTGSSMEKHLWNLLRSKGKEYYLDFTWQQFPNGSVIKSFKIRDRDELGDSPQTVRLVELLLKHVQRYLDSQ